MHSSHLIPTALLGLVSFQCLDLMSIMKLAVLHREEARGNFSLNENSLEEVGISAQWWLHSSAQNIEALSSILRASSSIFK